MDPVVANAADPQSYNAYSYARNNPVNFTDPTGMGLCGLIGCVSEGNYFPPSWASSFSNFFAGAPYSGPPGADLGSLSALDVGGSGYAGGINGGGMPTPIAQIEARGVQVAAGPLALAYPIVVYGGPVIAAGYYAGIAALGGPDAVGEMLLRKPQAMQQESGEDKGESGYTDKPGKIAAETGKSVKEVNKAIEKAKQGGLSRDTAIRNPDVKVHPGTGDVRPINPDGSLGDSIGNIFDFL